MAETLNGESVEHQLTCAICQQALKDPKVLKCFHIFCKDCLERYAVQHELDQLSVMCAMCRQYTLLSETHSSKETGVAYLQPAFHIHHLFEIQEALDKVKVLTKNAKCGKCGNTQDTVAGYC